MKEIKAYACDYCKKFYKHKSSAKNHEKQCYRNPNNRACLTCGNFDNLATTEYGEPYCHGYERAMTSKYFFKYWCPKWQPIEIEEDEIIENW